MSDRTLLEQAAKAAGYRIHGWINDELYVVPANEPPDQNFDPRRFMALTDNDDAFALAVQLGFEVYQGDQDGPCACVGHYNPRNRGRISYCIEMHKDHPDACAATRRAIVRAAAAQEKQ